MKVNFNFGHGLKPFVRDSEGKATKRTGSLSVGSSTFDYSVEDTPIDGNRSTPVLTSTSVNGRTSTLRLFDYGRFGHLITDRGTVLLDLNGRRLVDNLRPDSGFIEPHVSDLELLDHHGEYLETLGVATRIAELRTAEVSVPEPLAEPTA